MALYERWCAQCNDLHDSNALNNITCKKNILPGTKVWVKKPEPKLFLPVQKIPSNKNRLFGKGKGAIFKKKSKLKAEKAGPVVETAKWQLVPVLSRCQDNITVKMSTGFRVFNLNTSQDCLPANEGICADMTELHYAHMPAILYNLKKRALRKDAYTYIGNVLISINPLRDVDSHLNFQDGSENWPPHPRTVAERSFQKMAFSAAQRERLKNVDEHSMRNTKFAPSKKSLIDPNSNFAQQYGLVNQSIIISGESGSGKTEASKRVLSQLVEREGYGENFSDEDDPGVFDFQDNLIGTDPILESFGNAKTKRNPNSSRFGKFLQLRYDPPSYEDDMIDNETDFFIDEASITTYLLERSRVTYQEPGEGNFRIFYQLLTSPNEKIHKHLGFTAAGLRFRYLNYEFKRSDHDRIGYRDLRIALKMVKLRVRSLNLFEVVAAVLHIGNIKFAEEQTKEGNVAIIDDLYKDIEPPSKKQPQKPSGARGSKLARRRKVNSFSSMVSGVNVADKLRAEQGNNKQRSNVVRHRFNTAASRRQSVTSNMTNDSVHTDKSEKTVHRVPNDNQPDEHQYSPIRTACKLMRVNHKVLERMLLETQVKIAGGERITKRVSVEMAEKRRDAIAKHIYALMFEWIVEKLNDTLRKDGAEDRSSKPFIGILDVFGFEEFQKNSFEQLLINYANEVLLSLFAQEILIGESMIYKEEGLVIHEKEMVNIAEATRAYDTTLKLFEGYTVEKKSFPGIFATINSQQRVPQPSDKKLLAQLQKNFSKNDNFPAPHPSKRDKCFIVKHYASNVTYDIENFLQKNDQTLPPDMEDFFRASHHKILRFFPFLLLSEGKPTAISSKPRKRKVTRVSNDRNPRFSKRRGRRVSKASKLGSRLKGSKLKRKATKLKRVSVARNRAHKKNETVAAQFSKQIEKLRATLLQTSCSYIRCVKPNPYLTPPTQTLKAAGPADRQDRRQEVNVRRVRAKQTAMREIEARRLTVSASKKKNSVRTYFDEDYVSKQLKNLGVYDCVNVLKAGLPTRIPYPTFLLTYSNIISFEELIFYKKRTLAFQQRTFVAALMKSFKIDSSTYKLGKTKIFFRSGKLDEVKDILSKGQLGEGISNAKAKSRFLRHFESFYSLKLWRACIIKTKAAQFYLDELRIVRAALLIQRVAKRFLFHRKFSLKVKEKRAAICIQCFWRVSIAKRILHELQTQAMQQNLDVELDFETKQSKGTSEMDTTNWEDLSLVDNADAESVEDLSEISVVGEYNALRPTLKSYFKRRTTYNRKTLAVEKKFGTKYKAKHKRGENSLFSAHRQDSDWSNIEDDLLEFDGEDADLRMHPDQEVIAEDIDDFSSEYDYDSYDSEYDDEDLVEYELRDDEMDETGQDGTVKTYDESEMKGTYKTNESGTRAGSFNDMDLMPNKHSTIVRRRTRYTKAEMRSILTRSRLTRATKNGKKTLKTGTVDKAESEKMKSNGSRETKTDNKLVGKLKIAGKNESPKVAKDSEVVNSPYVKPLRRRAPVNKLNPKKSDYWVKRETKVGKAKPVWQTMKLRSVTRPNILREKKTEDENEPIDLSSRGIAARMAEKFGGSTLKRKPKP